MFFGPPRLCRALQKALSSQWYRDKSVLLPIAASGCGLCFATAALCDEKPDTKSAPRLLALKRDETSGNCTRSAGYKSDCEMLDLSHCRDIDIDVEARMARVGSAVTMEELSTACLQKGLLPLVVPEFRKITVGGALVGAGVESSSGRYGEFSEGCASCKVRLGSGEVVSCSDTCRQDLFRALSGSYGSLATVLEAEVCLVRAERHVVLQYEWFAELDKAVQALVVAAETRPFAEGLSYFENAEGGLQHVVITADWAQEADVRGITELHRPSDPWFYEHVRSTRDRLGQLSVGGAMSSRNDYIDTSTYLHRHERGAFWMARPEGDQHVPCTPCGFLLWMLSGVGRSWTDECWKTPFLFKMLKKAPQAIIADNFLITDIYTNPDFVGSLVHAARGEFALKTPIWLCPVRVPEHPQPLSPNGNHGAGRAAPKQVLIDVGLYGRVANGRGVEAAKFFERWGIANNARKMFYSQNYYAESDFWRAPEMFDKATYDKLRAKYKAEGRLVDLYTKVGDSTKGVDDSRAGVKYLAWWLLTQLV